MKPTSGYHPRHKQHRPSHLIAAAVITAATATPPALLVTATSAEAAICPSAPVKCVRVDVAPSSFVAGSTLQFTVTVTNESGGQSLGSANLDAPAGYTITHIDTPTQGSADLIANEIQLRNLGLLTGTRVTLSFTAQTASAAGNGVWQATAKQSNDYNGAGNDFVLDPASKLTTSGVSGTAGCSSSDVSCGTNFIRYDRASTVSTGSAVNSAVWLVGQMNFPATNTTGGQSYSMHAPAQPGSFCPVDGSPTQCTFEMDVDDVPAPYTSSYPATLTLLCDSSHCASNSGQFLLFKKDASGSVAPVLPCPLNVTGDPCYSVTQNGDGDTAVTIQNITAGDPQFAGISVF